ncbi:META domain-containing protein [Ruania albidiflava]|uniref:META domain-containing protein n=1 Tax=Ruania albidiflava TaxID=366586 RepID=UPI0023F08351|nr:META domain-containing protein [Ruania albidiflava]
MRAIRQVLALVTVALLAALTACGTTTNPAIGTWGTGQDGQPQLKLTHEGVVSGTDGCNDLKGSWSEDGDTITFYGVTATEMDCPDVDVWLTHPATATLDGDTLHVFDAGGSELGTLERS